MVAQRSRSLAGERAPLLGARRKAAHGAAGRTGAAVGISGAFGAAAAATFLLWAAWSTHGGGPAARAESGDSSIYANPFTERSTGNVTWVTLATALIGIWAWLLLFMGLSTGQPAAVLTFPLRWPRMVLWSRGRVDALATDEDDGGVHSRLYQDYCGAESHEQPSWLSIFLAAHKWLPVASWTEGNAGLLQTEVVSLDGVKPVYKGPRGSRRIDWAACRDRLDLIGVRVRAIADYTPTGEPAATAGLEGTLSGNWEEGKLQVSWDTAIGMESTQEVPWGVLEFILDGQGQLQRIVSKGGFAVRQRLNMRFDGICPPGEVWRGHKDPFESPIMWALRQWSSFEATCKRIGVQCEIVVQLSQLQRRSLVCFSAVSVLLMAVCIADCAAVFGHIFARRLAGSTTADSALSPTEGSAAAAATIAEAIPSAALMCAKLGVVAPPIIASTVKVVVMNFCVIFFIGRPQEGVQDADWRAAFAADPSADPEARRKKLRGAVVALAFSLLQPVTFLLMLGAEAKRALGSTTAAWETYQTALVMVCLHSSTLSLVQLMLRLQGNSKAGSLQQTVTRCCAALFAVFAVPATLTHGLLAAGAVLATLLAAPFAAGCIPSIEALWVPAVTLQSIASVGGVMAVSALIGICTHTVFHFVFAAVYTLVTRCGRLQATDDMRAAIAQQDPTYEPVPGVVLRVQDEPESDWFHGSQGWYAVTEGSAGGGGIWVRLEDGTKYSFGLHDAPVNWDVADPINELRPRVTVPAFLSTLPTATEAIAKTLLSFFVIQSLVMYTTLYYGGAVPLQDIPAVELDARNFREWIACQEQHLLRSYDSVLHTLGLV
eukprot:TRINITY_DN13300_c0_g4_i1.p1 TRINITY_DN13300_c0_g4~~TRINITY_DN13300_c0_g4_i1.p1  ORF type:complete len:853 (+),score=206.19 TRINITY_DN13300_c0_g4_i1:73-2559(+)